MHSCYAFQVRLQLRVMRSPSLLLRLSQTFAAFSPTLGWRGSESSSQSALTHDQTAHQKQAASDRPNRGGGGPGDVEQVSKWAELQGLLQGRRERLDLRERHDVGPSASALT